MKTILFIPILFITMTTIAQTQPPVVQMINKTPPRGYSQAAAIDLGNCTMLIISGQVALDDKGELVGKDDIPKQAEQVFRNIKSIIEGAGGTMNNIVKLGYFLTDLKAIQAVRDTRDKFINTQAPPASTLVQVNKLFRDDILIEIEATAVIPKK